MFNLSLTVYYSKLIVYCRQSCCRESRKYVRDGCTVENTGIRFATASNNYRLCAPVRHCGENLPTPVYRSAIAANIYRLGTPVRHCGAAMRRGRVSLSKATVSKHPNTLGLTIDLQSIQSLVRGDTQAHRSPLFQSVFKPKIANFKQTYPTSSSVHFVSFNFRRIKE